MDKNGKLDVLKFPSSSLFPRRFPAVKSVSRTGLFRMSPTDYRSTFRNLLLYISLTDFALTNAAAKICNRTRKFVIGSFHNNSFSRQVSSMCTNICTFLLPPINRCRISPVDVSKLSNSAHSLVSSHPKW